MTHFFPEQVLPDFQKIHPQDMPSIIKKQLAANKEKISALLSQDTYSWDNLVQPLEDMDDHLNKIWSPFSHMHAVMETESLRKAYQETLPLLAEYHTENSQNEALFKAFLSLQNSKDFSQLTAAQQKIIENNIRDFKLAGVHLSSDQKSKMTELQKKLSYYTTKFAENLLDATQAWTLHIEDKNQLAGLPEEALQLAIENAKKHGKNGYVITLDQPSYLTAIKFLRDAKLRQTLYEAYSTRASDQGPNANRFDNSNIMEEILKIRDQIAKLVSFENFATYSLATKMAKEPTRVLQFLEDLLAKSKPIAEKEYQEIKNLAHSLDGVTTLNTWDIPYYSEKLQEAKFEFSQESLRPYFPINKVLDGFFKILHKLYGITIKEQKGMSIWQKDVKFFAITDEEDRLRGGIYIDLYARAHKREGAWMDDLQSRRKLTTEKSNILLLF